MTEINLEDFTEFAKVKTIWNYCNNYDKKGLHEFLNNVVMNMDKNCNNGFGNMLPDLSDIYVLISNEDFPFDELTMNQKISIDLSVAKKNFVLGYIWIDSVVLKYEGCIPYHFISFIDSRISGLNIAKYMIEKYEEQCEEETHLFPFEIMNGAEKYWEKYFMEIYEIKNKIELSQMIIEYEFKESDIRWGKLFSAFEM
jgi:hypothetical protein